jgi:hypothetical protein
VQGLPDDLIGDVWAVIVGRIDMVHAGRDGFAEDGDGTVRILGRPPYTRAGQLHRAVTYPLDRQRRAREGELAAEVVFTHVLLFPIARKKQAYALGRLESNNETSNQEQSQEWGEQVSGS